MDISRSKFKIDYDEDSREPGVHIGKRDIRVYSSVKGKVQMVALVNKVAFDRSGDEAIEVALGRVGLPIPADTRK